MKLYTFPASTTCRPVMFFAADAGIELELEVVDLMSGAQYQPYYAAINPNNLVPVLADGDFRLTESSAILKYLAEISDSPAYPKDVKARARVNEMMDWFNTGFYRTYGYEMCYPQLLPHYKFEDEKAQSLVLAKGKASAERLLKILEERFETTGDAYLCGKDITIADYFASGLLSLGEVIGCTLQQYPNIRRWYDRMRARPNWEATNGAVFHWAAAVKGPEYVRV